MESSFLNPRKVVELAGLHEGMKVADLVAGAGFFTRAAARMVGPKGVVWAVESRQDLLPRIKSLAIGEGLHNVEVVQGVADHLGGTHLPDKTFDVVIVANALFALECKDCLADEVARILKRGGKALVVDWQDSFGGLGPHPDHVISHAAARKLFESHGFTFVDEVAAGSYHWGCILKRT